MRTRLFTSDPSVVTVLQDIDRDVVIQENGNPEIGDADLFIWDLDYDSDIRSALATGQDNRQLLLLVSHKTIHLLDSGVPTRCCALVKPINTYTVRAFLEMAARTYQLQRAASDRNQLRSDRDALLQYALATNLRLQEYDHERTNFLARALHDLRAPLTALHGYCGLLAAEQLGPLSAEQHDLLIRMEASTRRLARQSAGMFELAIRGRVSKTPERSATDIEDAVVQAVHEVYPQIQDKDQDISVSLTPPDGVLLTNSAQITQVFLNLLENCSKFTPPGGQIEITGYSVLWNFLAGSAGAMGADGKGTGNSVHARGVALGTEEPVPGDATAYRIDVRDTGPGIEPGLLSAIFEQYTSYSVAGDRSGGGLGLAICKMIVADHNGLIWADNSQQGAVFSVVLPFDSCTSSLAPEGEELLSAS